jgi:hypothetical protein
MPDSNPILLSVLIHQIPIHQYVDLAGDIFVEGRKGSEYALRLRNRSYQRLLVIPSVDGLGVLDGKPASENSNGYVIDPFQTIDVPGWTLDRNSVAKFKFGDKENSYTANSLDGSTSNVGVIGALVYSEKPVASVLAAYQGALLYNLRSGSPRVNDWISKGIAASIPSNNMAVAQASNVALDSIPVEPSQCNNLGTEFGAAARFDTRTTDFDKDQLIQTITIFYDDQKGLRLRGIEVIRNPRAPAPKPIPFPNARHLGCIPPAGWSR